MFQINGESTSIGAKLHTYLYEKKYNEAILILSKIQNQIPTFDWDNEIQKNNQLFFVEFSKFLAFWT